MNVNELSMVVEADRTIPDRITVKIPVSINAADVEDAREVVERIAGTPQALVYLGFGVGEDGGHVLVFGFDRVYSACVGMPA